MNLLLLAKLIIQKRKEKANGHSGLHDVHLGKKQLREKTVPMLSAFLNYHFSPTMFIWGHTSIVELLFYAFQCITIKVDQDTT